MSYVINQIQRNCSITDYLRSKNIHPKKVSSDKSAYCCPLHSGDNTPSFFVHHKPDGEDFYCWGCKAGGNIIHLWSQLEDKSIRDAVLHFGQGLNIQLDDHLCSAIENDLSKTMISQIQDIKEEEIDDEITSNLIFIGNMIREFIHHSKSIDEIERCSLVSQMAEKAAMAKDLHKLKSLSKELPSILGRRLKTIRDEQHQRKIKENSAWIDI